MGVSDTADPLNRPLYATRLTPYRSMTPRDVYVFIAFFSLFNVILSVPFFVIGAWPVAGFMGLDALALFIAFRVSFRSARNYETLVVTPLELVFAKIGAQGARAEWRFNPVWVRLEEKTDEEFGTERVALVFRGESVEIGAFLGPEQKAALAKEVARALNEAKRGVRFE